jgi:hypothetical protein
MRTKKALLALSTAIVLVAAGSLAQAKEHKHGGSKVVGQPRNAYGLIAPSQNRDTTPRVRPTGTDGMPPSLDFAPSRDFLSTLNNGG